MNVQPPDTNRSETQGESGVSAIFSNSTRLELVVVAAVLLVLMLYSRPPRSGNAGVRPESTEMATPTSSSRQASSSAVAEAVEATMQAGAETTRPDEMPAADVRPRTRRVGIVDARNSGNPKYKDLMYGEVSVRHVWNGGKFVWQKVCIVDEGNGVTSVWSFDQQNDATVTEREVPITTP
jgi:hypothetical protein